ncbi:MAG: aspartate aminotransferase family protein, partial [Nocardiopsis sp. BM-2018]
MPVHAQFSKHPYANELADALNRILHRELDTEQRFYAIFTNSGAEAIEAAVKNAELDRQLRLADLTARIDTDIEAARAAVAGGAATL